MEKPFIKKTLKSLQEHLRIPLFANAYALMTDQVATTGLGFLYWVLAARLYHADVVGENSAILSTVFFIVNFSELSMRSAMARFVPRAGEKTTRLILYTFGVNLIVAFLGSMLLFTVGRDFKLTSDLVNGIQIWPGWLVIFAMFWTIFFVQDGVLTGMRRARWVVAKNFIHSFSKILILFILIRSNYGLLMSWFFPVPFIVLGVTILIFWRFMPEHKKLEATQTRKVHRRELVTSITGDHIGTIIAEACVSALPLLILQFLGKEQTAYFYQAWLIYNALSTFAINMSSSFAVEASADMANILALSRSVLLHMSKLLVPLVSSTILVAPFVLSLFGRDYAVNGTVLLRWLVLSILPYMINNWFLTYSRVLNQVPSIIFVQSMQFIITLGATYVLLPRLGIAGVGIAWLMAQCVIAILIVIKIAPLLLVNTRRINLYKS